MKKMILFALTITTLVFSSCESPKERAQRMHNEEKAKNEAKREQFKFECARLMNIITDDSNIIYRQVEAYKELQKLMPKEFGNLSFQEAKK